jgi:hypothetical protein
MHGDDEPCGSVQRVELFDQWPKHARITDNVGIMNRAATEDVRSPVWPVVSRVLHTGPAPSARDQKIVDILDDWVSRDAPRLDADGDMFYDEPAPVIMDELWRPIADAVMSPVFGSLTPDLNAVRNLGSLSGESYVDKDLRTLLGDRVRDPFNLSYCGAGSLAECRRSLWDAVHLAADRLTSQLGEPDPAKWTKPAGPHEFRPRAPAKHLPGDEPADLPAGPRATAPRRLTEAVSCSSAST